MNIHDEVYIYLVSYKHKHVIIPLNLFSSLFWLKT